MRRAALLLLALVGAGPAAAQVPGVFIPPGVADTLTIPRLDGSGFDSLRVSNAPPLDLGVPIAPAAEGGIEAPVLFGARDSLRIVLAPRDSAASGDVLALFGDAQAGYEEATITAARLEYRAADEVVRADPLASDTGAVGLPLFVRGSERFTGRRFEYNLTTRRGRVLQARTQIEDGLLLGGVLKQQDAHVVFGRDVAYTTCTLDHPHYAVEAGRVKIVDGEEVFTGPIQLKLLGIPMPVLLPFGYIPTAEGRRSGPTRIDYGQESQFGLFLEGIGWYWAISDYLDAQVTGKIGTEGSFQITGVTNYRKRYAYDGALSVRSGRLRSGESTDPTFAPAIPFGVTWRHNQTFPAGQRLSGSVDFQSRSQRLVSANLGDQLRQSTTSTVAFSQSWNRAGRSLNASLRAFQDLTGGALTLNLPTVSFSQQRKFPFRRGRDDRWYEKISVAYTNQAANTYQFTPLNDSTGVSGFEALFDPGQFQLATGDAQRFSYQVQQEVPVSASFSVPRFNLSISPSLRFAETWASESVLRTYVDSLGRAVESRQPGFTAVRRAQASLSAATELYGTFPLRVGPVDGLRHTVRPSVGLSFEPNYDAFGFVREVQTDSTGRTQRYGINRTIPVGPTQRVSFGVENAFLLRTVRTDTTGAEQRTTSQVLSVSVNGGYNLAAEERPLDDLRVSFNSRIFGAQASGSAQYSFYALDTLGTITGDSYLDLTGRPARLTRASVRVGRSFRSRGGTGRRPDVRAVTAPVDPGVAYDPAALTPQSAVVGYVDYSAPWSFSLDVTASYNPSPTGREEFTAALGVNSFNARLSPNWSVTGSTGLDLKTLEPTTTRLGLRRDLHCWEMAINWSPIGQVRGFSVSLYVKSGYLRDLLRLDVPRSVVRSVPLGGFNSPF